MGVGWAHRLIAGHKYRKKCCYQLRGSKKHVHSREASTGHLYECPCASPVTVYETVLCSPMSHSCSTVCVTRTLDTPLGVASAAPAAPAAPGILLLQPLPS